MFQVGHPRWGGTGAGRKKSPRKQIEEAIKNKDVKAIIEKLIDKAREGDREAGIYIIDRVYGKPKQQTDIELTGAGDVGAEMLVRLLETIQSRRTLQLTGGNDAVQITEGHSESDEGLQGEEEKDNAREG